MKLIKPYFEIMSDVSADAIKKALLLIESAGRICYKSESKGDTEKFVSSLISRGHESTIEHVSISVKIVCDRGVSHELVRHRMASYSQESTRYCNYGKSNDGVCFIIPPWIDIAEGVYCPDKTHGEVPAGVSMLWFTAMAITEATYMHLLKDKWTPQIARTVLPNSLKTEIVMTANLREWRHFFKLRALGCSGKPHPQMLEIAVPMLEKFADLLPSVFGGLLREYEEEN